MGKASIEEIDGEIERFDNGAGDKDGRNANIERGEGILGFGSDAVN
jgi:hypothetical protein